MGEQISLSFFSLLGVDPGGGAELLHPPGFCPSSSHMISTQKDALKTGQSVGNVASGLALLPILPFLHFHGFFFLFSFFKGLTQSTKRDIFFGRRTKAEGLA